MGVELIIGLSSAGGLIIGGVLAYLGTWGKNRNDAEQGTQSLVLEDRRDTLSDRDNLISLLQGTIDSVQADMGELRDEVKGLRSEVGEVRTHNNALTTFVYKMLAVFRKYNIEHEIPDPKPEGIEF